MVLFAFSSRRVPVDIAIRRGESEGSVEVRLVLLIMNEKKKYGLEIDAKHAKPSVDEKPTIM